MLEIEHLAVSFKNFNAVDDVTFTLPKGVIGCLLGPSGCGKTTLLRSIAGFENVRNGTIDLAQKRVSSINQTVAPEHRNVGIVFQDFALFPHLTVAQNIGFGISKWDDAAQRLRVTDLLALVNLNGFEHRFPHELSGGQQQRIALARAIAPKPSLLLLDEPFANLDADLRESLGQQVRDIIRHEGMTALMVTHDQHEAFCVADQIGVMHQGKLHQWGTSYELYHRPKTKFVASFIGEGVLLDGDITSSQRVTTPIGEFSLPNGCDFSPPQRVAILVRPDDVIHEDDGAYETIVLGKAFRGPHTLYHLRLRKQSSVTLMCLTPSHHIHDVGDEFAVNLALEDIVVFAR